MVFFWEAIYPRARLLWTIRHKDQYWIGATKWQFIGTNDEVCDEKLAWTILYEDLSGKRFEWMMQNKYCVVENKWVKYKCLGISALESSYPDLVKFQLQKYRNHPANLE